MVTAIKDARWKPFVPAWLLATSSCRENAIRINETAVIRKQNTMLPAVSMRALPAGYFLASTFATALLLRIRVIFDTGSKMASAMDVKSERDLHDTAPYIWIIARMTFATKET